MSSDLIQGKKGSGKSKLAVMWMRQRLLEGRRVGTNLDLFLDKLMPADSRATAIRLPDKPKLADLDALGPGNNGDRYNPDHNGLLVLDELATWMNARSYQDKERLPVLNWLVHSRKKGWDTVFICQDVRQIDVQMRESHFEYVTRCVQLEKVRIPLIGGALTSLFGKRIGYLPRMHAATKRLGIDPRGLVAETWQYRTGGPTIQGGYDTLQEFQDDYPHGPHSLLSAWHLVGRHQVKAKTWWGGVYVVPDKKLKPKLPAVVELQKLPPDRRLQLWQELERENRLCA